MVQGSGFRVQGCGGGFAAKKKANLRPCGAPPSRGRRENSAFSHRYFERMREIFFVCGQAKDVRIAASGKHRAPSESEGRCFMQTALRKKTETGNEKDPSAALGMTKRGKRFFMFFHSATEANLRPLRGPSFQRKEGECRLTDFPRRRLTIRECRFPALSFRAKARNLFRLRSGKKREGSG